MYKRKEGFTLIELIIVIAILAIIVGVVSLAIVPYLEKSKKSVCIQERDTLQNDFCYQMAGKLIKGSVDADALCKEVMTSHGLTDEGGNKFSGLCRSGGVYTVTIDSTTMQIKDIVCSEHGGLDDDLKVSSDQADYLKAMNDTFTDFMSDTINATKVGGSYVWDSNGTLYTPTLAINLKKKLAESGFKVSDTAMWKVVYDKSQGGYMIYWYDSGKAITAPESGGVGKKMTVIKNADGTVSTTIKDFNCIVASKTVDRNGTKESYYAISNNQWG